MKYVSVAIDGPSGAGKSTVARAAAAQLGLTQSAVSHSINSLEEELGFAVIKRSRAGVKLTNEGERLLPAVRGLLNSAEQLSQVTAATSTSHTALLTPPAR